MEVARIGVTEHPRGGEYHETHDRNFAHHLFTDPGSPIQAQDDPLPITLEMRLGNGIVTSVAWSPDGSTLAVDGPGGVWLYNTADFAAPPRLLEGQGGTQQTIAFSPDGRTLASASNQWEKQVWLWDVASGELQGVIQTPDNSNSGKHRNS